MRRAALLLGLTLLATPAAAQMDSREGIALQNQILQLRQEMEQLRMGGGGRSSPPPSSSRGSAGSGELVGSLLDRVSNLEEEVRRLRGRVDVLENQNQRLRQDFEKYQGDMEFRLGQGGAGGGGGAAAPAPSRPAPQAPPLAPPTTSTGAPAPRTPDRALAEGQAALGRRDYAAAEAAAREALAGRGANAVAGQMLLADALTGKRDFGNAAIAYNEAFTRARTGPRAPEALIGLANSFQSLGNKREACDTLNDLRSQFPNLPAPMAARATAARQRSQCR
ncbi:hypothetical protein [Roseococcus sp. YIM B11640]|uniref:hypothetical protein n=1 Tax=Roseococcus sp. YIM B11640 TaxID=3133973 RepID=UPI003C799356